MTARNKTLGKIKNHPNSVGTFEDRILVYHLLTVISEWAKKCLNVELIFGFFMSQALRLWRTWRDVLVSAVYSSIQVFHLSVISLSRSAHHAALGTQVIPA